MKTTKKNYNFPPDFLWGTSTSAYQIEGGIKNDWSEWEISEKRIRQLKKDGKKIETFICGQAADSYNRYMDDIKALENLNCNAFRLGIEWARIEPQKGKWDLNEIQHYKEVISELKKRNIKVVLTLWHWTNPIWVAQMNGWANKKITGYFTRYTEFVVEHLGDMVDYWVVLNEPMIHVYNGYLSAKFPPNKKNIFTAIKTFNNLATTYNAAYKIIHKKYQNSLVSITHIVHNVEPAHKWNVIEVLIAKLFHYFYNDCFLQKIKNNFDYIGLDYYFHDRIVWYPPFKKNKNKKITDTGWEIYPKGIYNTIKYLNKFQKPIIVLENGLADADDSRREKFIVEHLKYVHKAIAEGIEVKGYFYWSLIDNFEWARGFIPKFGLYSFDPKTFNRQPRKSCQTYAKICKTYKLE